VTKSRTARARTATLRYAMRTMHNGHRRLHIVDPAVESSTVCGLALERDANAILSKRTQAHGQLCANCERMKQYAINTARIVAEGRAASNEDSTQS